MNIKSSLSAGRLKCRKLSIALGEMSYFSHSNIQEEKDDQYC